jgi:class 3 adenylate cyclase
MNTGERVRAERRLAAILAADVVGYSRLIGADEEGTLQRIRAIRAEVIDPKIATHHGRLVKTTGDGLLVEFGSVVDALRCATEVQREMARRNSGVVDEDVSRVNVPAYAAGIPKSRVAIGARALSDRSLRNFVDFSV